MRAVHPSRSEPLPTVPLWKFISTQKGLNPPWKIRLKQLAVEGRAYFPSSRDFNDPFDCLPHFSVPDEEKELRKTWDHLVIRMIRTLGDEIPEEVIRTQLMKSIEGENIVEKMKATFAAGCHHTASKMGVFCLSETIDSVLMWSHYASNHSGFALRFDPRVGLKAGLGPFFKVAYQEARPTISLFHPEDVSGEITDALATKAAFWSYEREWRAFRPEQARQIVFFDPTLVNGIAFGMSCPKSLRDEAREILGGRPVEFLEMVSSPERFDLRLARV